MDSDQRGHINIKFNRDVIHQDFHGVAVAGESLGVGHHGADSRVLRLGRGMRDHCEQLFWSIIRPWSMLVSDCLTVYIILYDV